LSGFGAARRGEEGSVSFAVDQYHLALVARLLLTGHLPPSLDDPTSLQAALPTELNPRRLYEPEVDHVLIKALAPDPAARFSSVNDFALALQAAVLKQLQHRPNPAFRREDQPTVPLLAGASRVVLSLPPLFSPKPYEPPRPRDNGQWR